MNFNLTSEQQENVLTLLAEIAPNDKATKGNVEKLRAHYMANFSFEGDEREMRILLSDIASMVARDVSYKKAARRKSISEWAKHLMNFDWNNIPGCVGFERVIVEA